MGAWPARLVVAGAAVCTAALIAGSAPASAASTKAAMLLPGSYNDQSWNALGYSGLQKMKELGFDTAVSENVPDSDDAAAMRDYADQGYNIVLGHSGRFLSAAKQVGPDYPKVQFIVGGGAGVAGPQRHVDRLRQRTVRLPDRASCRANVQIPARSAASTDWRDCPILLHRLAHFASARKRPSPTSR